ncbi:MAG TPA: IS256 family transposase [Candidatus Saccharimonadales bacterium]|nr:IS256 family transposase [Candidatus Saccharimonadales bacterium]
MTTYRKAKIDAKEKRETLTLQMELPMTELMAGARDDIETLCAQIGLTIMKAIMNQEVASHVGRRGEQSVYRHGRQKGYVVFAGRKVALEHPRMRSKDRREVPLNSYQSFQGDGRLQRAVARKLIRQCSTRNYEGALEECLQGYGIKRSSVSRHFQVTTALELKGLLERPVPPDLLAVLIDAKYFLRQCVVVALGIDREGRKHVLGLWEGATENATVAKGLLEDLLARGLTTERRLLMIIDGSKALRKAIQQVFGEQALVQRCRVHKQRNVVEHLPKEKQAQAIWRLRAAWGKSDPKTAAKELRKIVNWLQGISPMAARSLEEGLEETLTLQNLGVNHRLAHCLSSTNMIESCFSHAGSLMHRVKRWYNGAMVLRWAGATLKAAEKGFRRIFAFQHMPALEEALTQTQESLEAA